MNKLGTVSQAPLSGEPGEAALACCTEDTPRVADLRSRLRLAMEQPPVRWDCSTRIEPLDPAEPVAVRKARPMALKLAALPTDLS
jgi:hypothetical protein